MQSVEIQITNGLFYTLKMEADIPTETSESV